MIIKVIFLKWMLDIQRDYMIYSHLPFLRERMEINKCKKLICNLSNKKKYVIHVNSLKKALNHGLKLKKIHRVTELNQKEWLKKKRILI